ncbi:MAG: (d)CMP kinase [Boseongicola sp.]|nr:(d)CMP kinase [Boseongicola sp.]MDD9979278.1 (d)CMP kinase [Boseongicola sp.]
MKFTVAIDGPAAAGKGTISKAIAEEFGFQHLDTGLLYRAVGRRALDGVPADIAAATLRLRDIARTDLRTPEVAEAASKAAANPAVRSALVSFQVDFARREGGAVLDGRDIGTVICPNAEVKLFVTASAEARAHRRWLELKEAGLDISEAEVLENVRTRDQRDAERDAAPMVAAEDAVLLDTSTMDVKTATEAAFEVVRVGLAKRQ